MQGTFPDVVPLFFLTNCSGKCEIYILAGVVNFFQGCARRLNARMQEAHDPIFPYPRTRLEMSPTLCARGAAQRHGAKWMSRLL